MDGARGEEYPTDMAAGFVRICPQLSIWGVIALVILHLGYAGGMGVI